MRRGLPGLSLAVALVLAGCGADQETPPPTAGPTFTPVTLSALDGWSSDRQEAALAAFKRSCARFQRRDAARPVTPAEIGGTIGDWLPACSAAAAVPENAGAARRYFEEWFAAWRIAGDDGPTGLFTGYFEPELDATVAPAPGYDTPLHARPDDLVLVDLGDWRESLKGERIAGRIRDGRLKPYDSRAEIVAGALGQKAEVIAWLADPVDAFFLHIQGSGRLRLRDGSILRVGYDGHNGHVYYAIGRWLVQEGHVPKDEISLQSIRAWLAANPGRMHEVMNKNPSYIFFRRIDGDGPIGAQGVALTPGRSLAIDRRHLPLGAPVWVDIDYADESGRLLKRLMVAQDTGGAIRGVVRGDVFWGPGSPAEALAGPMAAKGSYVLLLPKGLNPPAGR